MIDSLLIGVDFSNTDGTGVLIVGRKRMNQTPEIVNAFSGEDARTLYKLLTTKTGTDAK